MLAVAKDRHHLTSFKKHPLLRPAARIAFDAEQGCVRRQPPIVKLGLRPGRCSRRQLSTAVPGLSLRQLVARRHSGPETRREEIASLLSTHAVVTDVAGDKLVPARSCKMIPKTARNAGSLPLCLWI